MQNKTRNSNLSRVRKLIKIVIFIMFFAFVVAVAATVTSNIIYKRAKNNRRLPQVPFAENLSFCPLVEDVYDTQYEKNSVIIVEKKTDYIVGDRVVVKKKYQDESNYFIENMFFIGVLSSANEDGYNIMLYSPDNKHIDINKEEVTGKIRGDVPIVGLLYQNMLGTRGYVLFGVVPALILVLLGLVLSLTNIRTNQDYMSPSQEDDMQYDPELENQIADRINRVNANIEFEIDEEEINPNQDDEPILFDADEEEIKLVLEDVPIGLELDDKPIKLALEQAPVSIDSDDGDIKLSLDRKPLEMNLVGGEVKLALEEKASELVLEHEDATRKINEEDIDITQKEPEIKPEKEIGQGKINKALKLQYEKPSEILNRILIKNQDEDFDLPNDNVQLNMEGNENTSYQNKQALTADEIIQMYRQQDKEKTEPKNDKLDNIAKLYYDNNLENYK